MITNRFSRAGQSIVMRVKLIVKLPIDDGAGLPQAIRRPASNSCTAAAEHPANSRTRLIKTAFSSELPKCWLN